MRFTRLRLNGFKSFVDPTDLVIGEGLTGVVGPNGCGKSNLLEALRWVMGENRPTAMRGGGMEDVIFAGSGARPARNFAEVALHIDNAERLAPAGFNEADQLDVTRRITRDAGSAYKAAGRDVRARDVQMLFADASTGSHSPALVRQGQISELISARPRARRRVLEEAAGISGLYQRRHEAELKLSAAETNLARVDDTIAQLAAQLTQLGRQAKQAARYRAIGAELRRAEGMVLYLRWKEADAARAEAEAALAEAGKGTARAEAAAREAAEARSAADGALPPLREEEAIASALLQRLQVERDGLAERERAARAAVETLEGRISQLSRDLEREQALNGDAAGSIARLQEEAAELTNAAEGHDDRLAAARDEADAAGETLAAREAELSGRTESAARLSASHRDAEKRKAEAAKSVQKSAAEAETARRAAAEAETAEARAAEDHAAAETAQAAAAAAAEKAESDLAGVEETRETAQGAEAAARAAHGEAEGTAAPLRAEVAGLVRLVAGETAEGDRLLDRVEVAPGLEAAFGAALAEDLNAGEVAAEGASGWAALPAYAAPPALPEGAAPLAGHVTAPELLSRRLGQVGLVTAADGAGLQPALAPGQRLVSREGDLWRWDGYRAAAADAPSAAALRLQQVNRLAALREELAAAEETAATAKAEAERMAAALESAAEADRTAREARRAADRAATEAARTLSRAEADRDRAASRRATQTEAAERFDADLAAAREAQEAAGAAQQGLGDLAAAEAEIEDLRLTVEAARMTMMTRRSARDELAREGEARAKREAEIGTEIESWQSRLETAEARAGELATRKAGAERELAEAAAKPDTLAADHARLAGEIETAETRRKAAADALAEGETALREAETAERNAERAASDAREARAAGEARAEATREAAAAAAERIAEEQETTPEKLLETLEADPAEMPAAAEAEAEAVRLRRQRDSLGAVNLRAEEDAREVQTEHDTLTAEKADLEQAIATLRSGIASLNREGRDRLLAAFDTVNANFATLFQHLFGGGEAKLMLVESDDPLEAGLEIMCQPPGKKLATLSLLSGGEQTLTALALIFAVFQANPAPICVLDEVDAPLDDANVGRFCDLLDEMTRRTETRFLVITHHAVTMARMDRLFGVTMAEQGVSQLVSVDLRKAEAMVA